MDLKTIIATWIKQARSEAGLSGADLGAKLALELSMERGITRANVSHWETGKHSPNLQQVIGIVKITGKGVPQTIIGAMQGKQAPRQVEQAQSSASTLERLDSDEWALIQMYRGSTGLGRDLIRKTAKSTETEAAIPSGRRTDQR